MVAKPGRASWKLSRRSQSFFTAGLDGAKKTLYIPPPSFNQPKFSRKQHRDQRTHRHSQATRPGRGCVRANVVDGAGLYRSFDRQFAGSGRGKHSTGRGKRVARTPSKLCSQRPGFRRNPGLFVFSFRHCLPTSGVSFHSVVASDGVGGTGCARSLARQRAARHHIRRDARVRAQPKWGAVAINQSP
jgi:hypothetical protein